MPTLRTYKVFISHSWGYSEEYYRMENLLASVPNFRWENLSVPMHDPVSNQDTEYELRNQMRDAHVFLILGGMYVAHSEWIEFEIEFARRIGRPIIGVQPWGSQCIPRIIQRAAMEIVGWNSISVVNAIRRYALTD